MIDTLTTSIATALVAGAAAAVSDGTREVLGRLAAMIRKRLRRSGVGETTLDEAISSPEDAARTHRLAALIAAEMRLDNDFAEQLLGAWRDLEATATRNRDNITNVVSGRVHGSVIQARDVQGGITIGFPPPPSGPLTS